MREQIRQNVGTEIFDKLMDDLRKFYQIQGITDYMYKFDIDHEGCEMLEIKLCDVDDVNDIIRISDDFSNYMVDIGGVGRCSINFTGVY